jgi:hypothetical protein
MIHYHPCAVYPGDPLPELTQIAEIDREGFTDHKITTGMHAGHREYKINRRSVGCRRACAEHVEAWVPTLSLTLTGKGLTGKTRGLPRERNSHHS